MVVPEDESSSESCLHCEINEVVREHIEGQKTVNMAELAGRMAESLVELILLAPEEEHGKLLARSCSIASLLFLENLPVPVLKQGISGDVNRQSRRLLVCCASGDLGARQMAGSPRGASGSPYAADLLPRSD
jgi:hypothetical protein